MRVAIFTNTYFPTVNGVAHCVELYAKGLQALGHEAFVFAPAPEGWDKRSDPPNVVRFPSVPAPLDWDYHIAIPFSRSVSKALRKIRFDLVHTQHPVWVGSWGQAYARWVDLPLVTTVHTEYELFAHLIPLPEALVESYLRSRVANYCNKCDVVTCAVPSARERLLQQGVTVPVEILNNPTDIGAFMAADGAHARAMHGIGPDELLIGYIGRMSTEKNLPFLLESVAVALRRLPRAKLMLVGGGVQTEDLRRRAAALGVAERVIFAGHVEHDQVPPYQAALDIFVTASLSETQPLAYTEAMACAKPIIALRAPGASDFIRHNETGILVEPAAGPEGMAEAITALAEDRRLRERLGGRAREFARQFDVPNVTARLLEIYALAAERSQTLA